MTKDQEIRKIFQEEARELIDKFGVLASKLKTTSIEKRGVELKELLRVAHSLKGAASTVGHRGLESLTHQIEGDLAPYREKPESLPDSQISELVKATSAFQILLEKTNFGVEDPGEPLDTPEETAPQRARGISIRVDTQRFDKLMGYTGDLLMSKARMDERHRRLVNLSATVEKIAKKHDEGSEWLGSVIREFREMVQTDLRDLLDFTNLTDGINEAMKKVRMVPLSLAEREWREIVRKVAHATNKEVDIAIRVGSIELDKHVLDLLRDPMMHLLRNAIDHGIEPSEERVTLGKQPRGQLEIRASIRGAKVRIEVRDDGRGIRRKELGQAVSKLSLLDEGQLDGISDGELLNFLFHSGLSTARDVSHMSGRGVGLDVVRSQIESLGGRVKVSSPIEGVGTTFVLTVPLSILSTVGLHVKSGATNYALPLEYVEQTVRVKRTEVEKTDGYPVLKRSDSDPIRLVGLADLLGLPSPGDDITEKVVVLSHSETSLGLMVDHIDGHREFVTKSLPWNLEQAPGVTGASGRPDGSVVITLDVPFLFERAGLISRLSTPGPRSVPARSRRILVVDDSLAARTMAKNFLLDGGYKVELAADGEAAWQRLGQAEFDLLVSDVDMPRLSGIELTRRVRANKNLRDLPVILVSSMNKPEDLAAGVNAGADEYIVKGTFDQTTLLEVVSKYL